MQCVTDQFAVFEIVTRLSQLDETIHENSHRTQNATGKLIMQSTCRHKLIKANFLTQRVTEIQFSFVNSVSI